MTFESLKIHPSIIKGLKDVGITEVKEIYKKLLQLDHRKGSALIKSSGSSLDELLLPIVHHLAESDEKQAKPSRIGILCPTANRAIEIEQWVWADKSVFKHNDGQKAKYKNKNSIKGTPTSNQQKKKGTKKQSTHKEVEAPRVNLEELDQKRKQKSFQNRRKVKHN